MINILDLPKDENGWSHVVVQRKSAKITYHAQETIDGVLYLCVYEGDGSERTLIKKTPASGVRG